MAETPPIEWTAELIARFWANVDRNGPVAPGMKSPCWIWTAGTFTNGYGQFRVGSRKVRAHRAAYELTVGPLPHSARALHRCDVRRCVRAGAEDSHIFSGTDADNVRDCVAKGRSVPPPAVHLAGATNPSAKLTAADVARLRAHRRDGWSYRRLAGAFRISLSQVKNIVHGRCWKEPIRG